MVEEARSLPCRGPTECVRIELPCQSTALRFLSYTRSSGLRDECKDEWISETERGMKKEKESREINRKGEMNTRRETETKEREISKREIRERNKERKIRYGQDGRK